MRDENDKVIKDCRCINCGYEWASEDRSGCELCELRDAPSYESGFNAGLEAAEGELLSEKDWVVINIEQAVERIRGLRK